MKRNNTRGRMENRRDTAHGQDEVLGFGSEAPDNRLAGEHLRGVADPFFPEHAPEPVDTDDEEEAAAEATEADTGQAPDDTLGLYLRQMGAIPLLNRKEELELSQR